MELLKKIPHPIEIDDLKKSFRLFVHTIIKYIEGYYKDRVVFYKLISIFNETDIDRIEWKNIKDCLYNDFNHIKSKFVEFEDKFGDIYKQIQAFVP